MSQLTAYSFEPSLDSIRSAVRLGASKLRIGSAPVPAAVSNTAIRVGCTCISPSSSLTGDSNTNSSLPSGLTVEGGIDAPPPGCWVIGVEHLLAAVDVDASRTA